MTKEGIVLPSLWSRFLLALSRLRFRFLFVVLSWFVCDFVSFVRLT